MIEVLYVSIGGFFGAICRFKISKLNQNNKEFPIGTLTVNLIGSFLLGFFFGLQLQGQLYSLLGVGFMGAFTTFSTFKLESEQLIKTKKKKYFYNYLAISYICGISLAFFGLIIGRGIG